MRRFALALALVLASFPLAADEQHHHDHGDVLGNLGNVTFKTSCAREVQKDFSRAVAMMHSFWYAEAEKGFRRIADADPRCAMAWWGVAMSNYHPLWAPPTPSELKIGSEAAANAMSIKSGSERERAYIEAINAFYSDSAKRDHKTRAAAYAEAMERVARANAKDHEASIFYALALLGTASPNDKTYAVQKQAAEILNRMLALEPEHPGIAHYIIHSYDYPQLASLALPAARAYAKLAPGSPHALHMPSHIFTRLGLWDESIASNIASAEKARAYVRATKPNGASFDELHAVDYLVYAYLQEGKDEKAKELLDRLDQVNRSSMDNANFAAAYAAAAAPARYAIERRKWDEAVRLSVRPADFPWKEFPYAEANIHFARAIGAARSGDLNTAKAAVDRLGAIRKVLLDQNNKYWADQVEIQRLAGQAWLAQAAGLNDEAIRLMRASVDLEDSTEKHPVTPGPIVPARELMAEMLLENGKPAEALAEAERALTNAPNRYNGVWLAARAAERASDVKKAEAYQKTLVSLSGERSLQR